MSGTRPLPHGFDCAVPVWEGSECTQHPPSLIRAKPAIGDGENVRSPRIKRLGVSPNGHVIRPHFVGRLGGHYEDEKRFSSARHEQPSVASSRYARWPLGFDEGVPVALKSRYDLFGRVGGRRSAPGEGREDGCDDEEALQRSFSLLP